MRLGILMTSRSLHSTSPQANAVEVDESDDDNNDDDDRLAAIMSTIKVMSNQSGRYMTMMMTRPIAISRVLRVINDGPTDGFRPAN